MGMNRADIVHRRDIRRCQHVHNTRRRPNGREIDGRDFCMGRLGKTEIGMQGADRLHHVVDIVRLTGDMFMGGVVTLGAVDAAPHRCRRALPVAVHQALSRTGAVPVVSR